MHCSRRVSTGYKFLQIYAEVHHPNLNSIPRPNYTKIWRGAELQNQNFALLLVRLSGKDKFVDGKRMGIPFRVTNPVISDAAAALNFTRPLRGEASWDVLQKACRNRYLRFDNRPSCPAAFGRSLPFMTGSIRPKTTAH